MARIRRSVLALTGLAFAATGCAQAPAVGAEGQAAFARIPSAMGTTTPSGTPSNGLVVVVRVRLTGGPMRRDGGMALNHSPANGQRVIATGPAGRRASTTNGAGEARL